MASHEEIQQAYERGKAEGENANLIERVGHEVGKGLFGILPDPTDPVEQAERAGYEDGLKGK